MPRARRSTFLGIAGATCISGAALALLGLTACEKNEAPAPPAPRNSASVGAGRPELPAELAKKPPVAPPEAPASGAPAAPTSWSIPPSFPPDYKGSWFAVTALGAGIYVEPSFESKKLGYMRGGAKAPVLTEPVSRKNCTAGWYQLVSGGFICANLGTTSLDHPEVKFGARQPDLTQVLPYPYARNAKNGTPLYKSVPSREQMLKYEPYLAEKEKEKAEKEAAEKSDRSAKSASPALARTTTTTSTTTTAPSTEAPFARSALSAPDAGARPPIPMGGPNTPDAGAALLAASLTTEPASDLPWWQRENIKDTLHEVKLEHLEADADDVLAKRMVSGFYVAVDKTFRWNGRAWYKTTKGLVAPTDRFWQTTGSDFKGLEIDGTNVQLPLGWVYGGRKSAGTYKLDEATGKLENAGTVDRFEAIQLTGRTTEVRGTHYEELRDGTWIKRAQVRKTAPGPLPAGLAENERWIDVNLETQTLVAFVGQKPVYATLISSGKESKIKEKDHRTPLGEWRIREKHITTTMDGDGSAAGDLPYSIEDVPFAMYYHKAYALHGAFWHSNYGVQMSHGCVNLAPLDAKHLFFFADPPIPAGFHGVFASETNPGTRVVVHE